MLGGHAELLLDIAFAAVFLRKNVELSHHLTGVLHELSAVVGEGDSPAAAVEYLYTYLLFQLLHR